jgi:hypothetical protein
MNTNITPGLWTISTHKDKFGSHGTRIIANDAEIAHVYSTPSEEANARLIAAAPELLAALEYVVGFYDKWETSPVCNKARVAIAKVKESQ